MVVSTIIFSRIVSCRCFVRMLRVGWQPGRRNDYPTETFAGVVHTLPRPAPDAPAATWQAVVRAGWTRFPCSIRATGCRRCSRCR